MDWQERLIGLYLYICDHYEDPSVRLMGACPTLEQ